MVERRFRRREFVQLSAAATLGAVVTACGAPKPEVIEKEVTRMVEATPKVVEKVVTVEAPAKVAEPPLVAEKVAGGALPALPDRLPANPVVVGGREAIGEYGGEVRMTAYDTVWHLNYGWPAERMIHYSDMDLRTLVPNIFESWEVAEDGKTFTFHLRRGMKWSDGQPLTTADVEFWWVDFATNEDLGWFGWQWRYGGERASLEIVDDFTFKVTFVRPFGLFPAHFTRWHMGQDFLLPKHYCKQFHIKYTDEAKLNELAQQFGVETWQQVFYRQVDWGVSVWQAPENAPEFPSLSAWVVKETPQEGVHIWERNPYYWKVDQAGNQLPYLDNLRFDYVTSVEALTMKIVQGEIDYSGPHDVTIARYPLYKENAEKGKYIVGDYLSCMTDRYVLFPQHNLTDKVLEKIVNHPNFVRALSVAIDREEINQSLYYGLARMGQLGPMPNSKYYKEKYGTAWAQYDPKLGNQLLDEMGLSKRDGEGFRLRPDGQRLQFNIEHSGTRIGASTAEFTEMVVDYWRALGVDATTKEEQESLYSERLRNGEVHCGTWHADRCTDLLLPLEMNWYLPVSSGQGGPAQWWSDWFNAEDKTTEGLVEPPEEIKKLYDLYADMCEVTDENKRVEIGQQIFDYLADKPLSIGSVLESPAPLIFNKNMRNLPRPKVPVGWDTYGISTYHPEAFFYEGGQRA